MGNLPPIQTSWAAYDWSFLTPLACGSRTFTASLRRLSIASRSLRNMSGCWSYLELMYWRMVAASDSCVDLRNGSAKMLLVLCHGARLAAHYAEILLCMPIYATLTLYPF